MNKDTVSPLVTLKPSEYVVSGTLDDPPLSYPEWVNFSLFRLKSQPTVYITLLCCLGRRENSSRQIGLFWWAGPLSSVVLFNPQILRFANEYITFKRKNYLGKTTVTEWAEEIQSKR